MVVQRGAHPLPQRVSRPGKGDHGRGDAVEVQAVSAKWRGGESRNGDDVRVQAASKSRHSRTAENFDRQLDAGTRNAASMKALSGKSIFTYWIDKRGPEAYLGSRAKESFFSSLVRQIV